ncbi:MAG: caspase family protein [Balneolaceae bacterium]|nr:caspase family protein [Balneolaceae bacterium]
MARKYALFVGNSEYDSESLVDLDAPIADVQDLASVFRDSAIGGFDEVIELINSTESEIRQKISSFFLQKKPDDLLLLYFSGHGVLDDRGHLYLAVKDTQPDLLRATAISADFIADDMDLCRSKRQILILDCCHSGAFRRGIKADDQVLTASTFEGNGSGRIVLTASDRREFAMEGNQVLDKANTSLFTHFLLEGIKSGNADRDGDSLITLDEWYDYAYEKVVENLPTQTPRRWVYNQEGKLIIARNPCLVEPADLSKELRDAIADDEPPVRLEAISRLADILHGPDRRLAFAARESLENLQKDESIEVREAAKRILKGIKSAPPVVSAETRAPTQGRNVAFLKNYKDYWRTWSLAATIALTAGAIGWTLYPPSGSNNLADGKEPASSEQADNQVAGISGGDFDLPPEKPRMSKIRMSNKRRLYSENDTPEEQQAISR